MAIRHVVDSVRNYLGKNKERRMVEVRQEYQLGLYAEQLLAGKEYEFLKESVFFELEQEYNREGRDNKDWQILAKIEVFKDIEQKLNNLVSKAVTYKNIYSDL